MLSIRPLRELERLAMARMISIVGRLALLCMAAQLVFEDFPRCSMTVEAYELVFSDQVIPDLSDAGIDMANVFTKDWLSLPLAGSCGLAARFVTPHDYNTPTGGGTLYTTFQYLTTECTAEYSRDINACAVLNADFTMCMGFPMDSRASSRSWGYCSNQNSRVSYMWIPNTIPPTQMPTPMTTKFRNPRKFNEASSSLIRPPQISSPVHPSPRAPLVTRLCSSNGQANKTSTNPRALAKLHKDTASIAKAAESRVRVESANSTSGQICDWSYSNLIPAAYDGVQNVLTAGQSIQSYNDTYMLIMQTDCNLVLYKKRDDGTTEWNGKWATFSQFNDPFQHACYLELQPDGNLVLHDPYGVPRWQSGSRTPSLYTTALTVAACGNVVVVDMTSGAIIWATHTGHS